ncbi:conserved hypothetical protein [Flavobacterium psychrophilum]|uniref:hypothetical protein n=1 Tax=Flavobacterium psychrophilum TaxID=96345 RepID=UPI000B7C2BD8|nr:hypothetical protein [Flavobacterium psychrophilum]SNB29766.1 conserved hypothetical protein [Flavobacterium psychrophilum]
MKKGFGIFFIIIGILNLIIGIGGLSTEFADQARGKIFFGIGALGFGMWMVNSVNRKDENLPKKQ